MLSTCKNCWTRCTAYATECYGRTQNMLRESVHTAFMSLLPTSFRKALFSEFFTLALVSASAAWSPWAAVKASGLCLRESTLITAHQHSSRWQFLLVVLFILFSPFWHDCQMEVFYSSWGSHLSLWPAVPGGGGSLPSVVVLALLIPCKWNSTNAAMNTLPELSSFITQQLDPTKYY